MKLTTKGGAKRNSNKRCRRRPLLASISYFEKFNFYRSFRRRTFEYTLNFECRFNDFMFKISLVEEYFTDSFKTK